MSAMIFPSLLFLASLAAICPLMAGSVLITSLPDEEHPLAPLTSFGGIPLTAGAGIRVGTFPGLAADDLLDAAAGGGLAQVSAAFLPFGEACSIGDGVEGAAGSFEISTRHDTSDPGSAFVGKEIFLFLTSGEEFLVAQFPGQVFEADPETGLEPVVTLHLADAKLIIGNRNGATKFASSPAPSSGSFDTWIDGFDSITDPTLKSRDADADGDGRSNFLEYVTGGNPGSALDQPPCALAKDEQGSLWVRFSRETGIGSAGPVIESSGDLGLPWQVLTGEMEPDPDPPVAGSLNWMRIRVPESTNPTGFFRVSTAD
jgi:hypothetical protein